MSAGPPLRAETELVGRHAEAALIAVTLDQSSPGAPTALVVRGEPGIGKTRLLDEAVGRARGKGHHVVWVRANALEARVPFGALSFALERASRDDPAFAAGRRGDAYVHRRIDGRPGSGSIVVRTDVRRLRAHLDRGRRTRPGVRGGRRRPPPRLRVPGTARDRARPSRRAQRLVRVQHALPRARPRRPRRRVARTPRRMARRRGARSWPARRRSGA